MGIVPWEILTMRNCVPADAGTPPIPGGWATSDAIRFLLQSPAAMFAVANCEGDLIWANQTFAASCGLSPDTIAGTPLAECVGREGGTPHAQDAVMLSERSGVNAQQGFMEHTDDAPGGLRLEPAGDLIFVYGDSQSARRQRAVLPLPVQSHDEIARIRRRLDKLSPREREVLAMVTTGHSSKQIAAQLGISPRTAANHRASIIRKTQAENSAALARMATLAGILDAMVETEQPPTVDATQLAAV